MFTTVEDTKKLTGYDVTIDDLYRAQSLLETFIGTVEEDIDNPNDIAVMGKATAYQAAYMKNNYDRIFEQMAVKTIAQSDGGLSPDSDLAAPFIAPLAFYALRSLSWKRSRSVKTGSIFSNIFHKDGWETE